MKKPVAFRKNKESFSYTKALHNQEGFLIVQVLF